MLTLKHNNSSFTNPEFSYAEKNPDGVYLSRHEVNILRNSILGSLPKDVNPNDVGKLECINMLNTFVSYFYERVLTAHAKPSCSI